ncbi:MAG: AbrB/MazE/SpoVT family DNA-binding domain-containing protein [Opitutus sp.]|nr:AbrB/MazE/SpoVT family DNA-binding domain-containing protein [Opitutus sp.]
MTTTLSSRGQVVLPQNVRAKLGLRPGTRFEVSTSGEKIVLVPQSRPEKVRLTRDRKTGLPTFHVPPGTPPMTSAWVRGMLADFP